MAADTTPIPPAVLVAHAGCLRGLARTLVADETQGDDLAQEAFLRALERPPRKASALSSWLWKVVRNLAVNAARGERRRQAREEGAARPEAAPSALDEALTRERIYKLTEAVLRVPDPFQEALLLRYYHELDFAEIGGRQGVPEATARTRVHRALARLREELDRVHGGDRRAWFDGLLPLALPRIPEGRPLAGPALAGSVASWIYGGLALKMLVLTMGLLAGLAIFLTAGSRETGIPDPPAGGGSTAVAAGGGVAFALHEDPGKRNPVPRQRDEWVLRVGLPSAEPAGIPAEDAVEVRVVEAGTGAPVPGATCAWWGSPHPSPLSTLLAIRGNDLSRLERSPWPLGPDRLVEVFAPKAPAGGDGSLGFPRRPWPVRVWAWHGERWGEGVIGPDQISPFRLELHESREVLIQAVDGQGRALAGVVVSLLAREGPGSFLVWKGSTEAPGGTVRAVYHPGRIKNRVPLVDQPGLRSFDDGRHRLTLWALFAAPIMDGPEVRIDPEAPPTSPIRLELPATGDQGRRVPEYAIERIENGLAVFPMVSLDRKLEFSFELEGREWYAGQARGRGPTRPGEEVVVPIRLKARGQTAGRSMLRGRLVDGQGRALAGILVQLAKETLQGSPGVGFEAAALPGTGSVTVTFFHTNPEGRFEIHGDGGSPMAALGQPRELTFTWWRLTTPDGVPEGPDQRLELLGPDPPEGRELGDIVLADPPLLAEGVVRDAQGSPVPGASVRRIWLGRGATPMPLPGNWMTETDAEGRFRLDGYGKGMLSLFASKAVAQCRLTVPAGTGGIDLVLAPGPGAVDFSLLCDPGIPPDRIAVFLGERGPLTPFPVDSEVAGSARGRLRVPAPGFHDLHFRTGEWVVARVPGVLVRQGEVTRDPRLLPADLRGAIRLLLLEVLDEKKTPVGEGVWVASARSPGSYKKVYPNPPRDFARGSLHEVPVPAQHDRFLVGVKGRPPSEIAWQAEEQQVVLARGFGLRLRPSLPPTRMQAGERRVLSFGARLIPVEPPSGVPANLLALFPEPERSGLVAGGEAGFRVAFPGRYRLEWWAEVAAQGQAVTWLPIPVAEPIHLEVSAHGPGPIVEVALDQVEVERALTGG